MIHHGDCLDVMAGMDPESVDAIVTDPPYGLEFMGKAWDKLASVPDRGPGPRGRNPYGGWHGTGPRPWSGITQQQWHANWATAAFRVAKPSAYLLAFGGTRTVHRMTVALEDAGWIIRDMLVWAYASGFPKSKASLKPAWEPIVMARKPGPLRMLAIDECRIGTDGAGWNGLPRQPGPETADMLSRAASKGRAGEASADRRYTANGGTDIAALPGPRGGDPAGRWPANLILTDPIFDGGIEGVVGGGRSDPPGGPGRQAIYSEGDAVVPYASAHPQGPLYFDGGTYSRFFLIPKADRADREPIVGLWQAPSFDRSGDAHRTEPAAPPRVVSVWGGDEDDLSPGKKSTVARRNSHPTVKPVDLMRHLVRLVTPTGGIVLDPFLGSGTTAIAAEMEGFEWIGIEREAEYVAIAVARLNGTQRGLGLGA